MTMKEACEKIDAEVDEIIKWVRESIPHMIALRKGDQPPLRILYSTLAKGTDWTDSDQAYRAGLLMGAAIMMYRFGPVADERGFYIA